MTTRGVNYGIIAGVDEVALTLLRLLADDAPAAELAAAADRIAVEDPAARDLALRIRSGMDASKRRAAELSALVDVARELASSRDPGRVFDTIVHRARTLVGTDVAYLTLYDPEHGDTFMRATDGSVSAAFQQLRLPLGAGLGGLVAETHKPYWTADYPGDRRFRHTSTIDDAVGEEGLVAICGTPLIVDSSFVGVLFASNRTRRPFSRDEVSLLGSLAALAAVTLVQVRAATETADALAQLSEAHAGVEHAAAAHDRFADIVLSGGDVDAIAAALAELLGVWVVLVDAGGNELASAGTPDRRGLDRLPALTNGRLNRVGDHWAITATAKGESLGALVIGGVDELPPADRRIVERAAVVTALVLLFRRQAAEQSRQAQADVLADALGGTADPAAVADRARLLGHDLPERMVVAVCHGDSGARLPAPVEGRLVLSGRYDGESVLLLDLPSATKAAAEMADLARRTGMTIGVTGPAAWGAELVAAHRQAARLVGTMIRLGRTGQAAAPDDLGLAGLVGADSVDVAAHVTHVLGPLLAYDERRGTDLVTTLAAYFAASQSPTRAAAVLHVHPNTVQQRLDRITALLGERWQHPDRALDLQVALRLRATL
ncbi:helix-turn-helix domain-containing protein [Kribbella deserti]|uniref:Helix-turn-helix domain-containing protein n=1 Tax=Kribbella deserti TaxID=1926257 RepID=A0ABV6QQ01_9ACTN